MSQYRSVLGQILWLAQQSRLDLCVGVSLLARRTTRATVEDAVALNRLARVARDGAGNQIVIRRRLIDLSSCVVLVYGDAAFANAEGDKSQFGMLCLLTHQPDLVVSGRFDLSILVGWHSGTVKRVVRSTLAAEGYASCESSEALLWTRYLLAEMYNPGIPLKDLENQSSKWPGVVLSDCNSLTTTVNTDVSGNQSADRRLRIVIAMLREIFADPKANLSLKWIPTWAQAADGLTKLMLTIVLLAVASSRRFTFPQPVTGKGSKTALITSLLLGRARGSDVCTPASAQPMDNPFPVTVLWILILVLSVVILFLLPLAYLGVKSLNRSVRELETQTEPETFRASPRSPHRHDTTTQSTRALPSAPPAQPVPAVYVPLSDADVSRVMSHRDPFRSFSLYAEQYSSEHLVHALRSCGMRGRNSEERHVLLRRLFAFRGRATDFQLLQLEAFWRTAYASRTKLVRPLEVLLSPESADQHLACIQVHRGSSS